MTLNSINNDQYTKDYEAVQKKGWRKRNPYLWYFQSKTSIHPYLAKTMERGSRENIKKFSKKCSLTKMAGEITPYKNSRIKSLNCSALHYKPMFSAILVMLIKLTVCEFGNLTGNSTV